MPGLREALVETFAVARVASKTDARNARARAAIAALGAAFEGVLRARQPSAATGAEDRPRDTARCSIVRQEWPTVRARLLQRIAEKSGVLR